MAFFIEACKTTSSRQTFGIYDPPPPASAPAFIVEDNAYSWIAVVQNDYQEPNSFFAIDHCVEFPLLPDGREQKRCDGVLISVNKIAFVELKTGEDDGPTWVTNAVNQLVSSIKWHQELQDDSIYEVRRAYICNSQQPRARRGQAGRIEKFALDTNGYALYIKQRINLYDTSG